MQQMASLLEKRNDRIDKLEQEKVALVKGQTDTITRLEREKTKIQTSTLEKLEKHRQDSEREARAARRIERCIDRLNSCKDGREIENFLNSFEAELTAAGYLRRSGNTF